MGLKAIQPFFFFIGLYIFRHILHYFLRGAS